MYNLRYYQDDSVKGVRLSYQRGKRRPLLVIPTGGGKTICFAFIAHSAQGKGKRVLVLVHRMRLLRQASSKMHEFGVYHGLINKKFTPDLHARTQIAMVQTLVKRLAKLQPPDLIIIDEAHHALAKSYRDIINYFPSALVLGVTATPCRGDGSGLGIESGGVFDDIVIGPQIGELIEDGFLCKPIVYAPKDKIDLSNVHVKMGDYVTSELAIAVDKPKITGDAVEHYTKICPGVPCMVFCVNVQHAKHVAEEFRAAGYRAYSVDGTMEETDCDKILNGLGDGSVQVVTSCDLVGEGVDVPAIRCVIKLRPTKSTSLYIQQGGRSLRPVYAAGFDLETKEGRLAAIQAGGKPNAIILDHVGNTFIHGLIDEPREWSLEGDVKRKKKKKTEDEGGRVMQCESCYAMHEPASVCPVCGHVRKIKERTIAHDADGELRELTAGDVLMMRKKKAQEVGRADTLEKLLEIEVERGYKRGWAKHAWQHKKNKKEEELI